MTSEFESRLTDRARRAGLSLPSEFSVRAERFYNLLKKWNATTNLTALELDGCPDASLDRLFIEPLLAGALVSNDPALLCVDIGSGGGSPAIPFALTHPLVRMLMVESVGKKAAFLREAVRVVGLQRTEVNHARFEDLASELTHTIDLVLIRGVKITKGLSKALQSGLKQDGRLFAFGASGDIAEFNWRQTDERQLSLERTDENTLQIYRVDRNNLHP